MTALGQAIRARIEMSGPLTLAEYMTECLLHPEHGYYMAQDPLGRAGDFITAPEISQMFGELIGLAIAQAWLDQGAPGEIVLAELGPGRGTLMADALRAMASVPGLDAAIRIHLVEASPHLRSRQAAAIGERAPVWHDSTDTLPDRPLFLVANEFFDALPIRQFIRDGAGWRERVIGCRDGALAFGLSESAPIAALQDRLAETRDGDVVEIRPAAQAILADIADRIGRGGGAAVVVDYGHWGETGDTFQAVQAHQRVSPLAAPGQADLTAHVDFRALAQAAEGRVRTGFTRQGEFLERLGITARARSLASRLTGAALDTHVSAHRRLTHPDEMGSLFKVLVLSPESAPQPPGLDQ